VARKRIATNTPLDNPVLGLSAYELKHLVTHLHEAGMSDAIHAIFELESRDAPLEDRRDR